MANLVFGRDGQVVEIKDQWVVKEGEDEVKIYLPISTSPYKALGDEPSIPAMCDEVLQSEVGPTGIANDAKITQNDPNA